MSDSKSKLPDFKEISSMAGKLFHDIKKSVGEIIVDYKKHRDEHPAPKKAAPKAHATKAADEEKPVKTARPKKPKED